MSEPGAASPGANSDSASPGNAEGVGAGQAASGGQRPPVTFGRWMASMWGYTAARVLLFGALWGIAWLLGVKDVLAGLLVAAVLSIPLAYALLSRPRARLAADMQARIEAHVQRKQELDAELNAGAPDEDD